MTQRVLFVDDEPNVLEGIQRTLRLIAETGSFALVISDMRMPAMMIRLARIAGGVGVTETFRVRVAH